MTKLALEALDLISTLRVAPLNGAPSSQDYNDSCRETLADLSALAGVLNNQIVPLVNALSDVALGTPAVGIEGRTVYADSSDVSALFFDSINLRPLTIAEAIRLLNSILATQKQKLLDLSIQVSALQARQSSTNQNDIVLSVQNFSDSLNVISAQVAESSRMAREVSVSSVLSTQNGRVYTGIITPSSVESVDVLWNTPFADNNYRVSYALEGVTDDLEAISFSYLPTAGSGIRVRVRNNSLVTNWSGYVHAAGVPFS